MLMLIAAASFLQASPALSPMALVDDVRKLTVAQDNDQRFEVLTRMLHERNVPFTVEPFTIEKPVAREPRTRGRNIIVSLGEGADELVIGAHYDAVRLRDGSLSRGAVDNGASSVLLVYLAEALRAEPLQMRVRVVWFDMEETGHFGSLRYVEAHAADRIRAMLNLDINAYGDTILFAAPPEVDDAWLRRTIVHTCADQSIDCVRFASLPESDDRSFGKAGIPTLSIAMLPALEAHQFWLFQNGDSASGLARGFVPAVWRTIHTTNDVVDKVDGASMARMHRFALALVRQLSSSQW
jgi:Zn-dependent M28 family amino/carboxypeptidase